MSDLDEKLTSILSSIVESEPIDGHHPLLLQSTTGLSLPSLSGRGANDENDRLKHIESITKSLQHAEVQLKQSQLQQRAANNGCEVLMPSLSAELLPNVLDDSAAIAELIEPGRISDIDDCVLGVPVATETLTGSLGVEESHDEPCAIVNTESIGEVLERAGNGTHLVIDDCDENTTENLSTLDHEKIRRNVGIAGNAGNCDQEKTAAALVTEAVISYETPSGNSSRKRRPRRPKRRRIVACEDSESDTSRTEGEKGLTVEKGLTADGSEKVVPSDPPESSHTGDARRDGLNQDPSDIENEYVSLTEPSSSEPDEPDTVCIPNERPGPKSRKQSTLLSAALKAKALLESAVVIPAEHKKKHRIGESDDDATARPSTSVDDIGRIGDDNTTIPPGIHFEREDDESPAPRRFESRIERGIGSSEPFLIKMVKSESSEDGRRRPPMNRMTTRIRFEQSDDFEGIRARPTRAAKKVVDFFETSLNAGYVDTSTDDEIFSPNEPKFGHASTSFSIRGKPHPTASQSQKPTSSIPNDVYFNSSVPLNVLLSYDNSSSDEQISHSSPETISQAIARMPPVYRIPAYVSRRDEVRKRKKVKKAVPKPTPKIAITSPIKPTIYSHLEYLKRCLKASGIKVVLSDLLKGCASFQERCSRVTAILNENGIDGEPTVAKCKQLKMEMTLKDEVAALDPSVIIDVVDADGRPRRATRMATKRRSVGDNNDKQPKVVAIKGDDVAEVDNDAPTVDVGDHVKNAVDMDSTGENGHMRSHHSGNHIRTDCRSIPQQPTEETLTEAIKIEKTIDDLPVMVEIVNETIEVSSTEGLVCEAPMPSTENSAKN